tara:strand:+ start:16 stop:756 length:741 start_codon:yes stop_codon:yes gene_type:complete
MSSQIAYNSSNNIIQLLTNGDFSTNDNVSHNRLDLSPGNLIKVDLGTEMSVDKLKIAGGNANWGGNEMPKNIKLHSSNSLDGPWEHIADLEYIINGTSNRDSAEAQEISFTEKTMKFAMLTFVSSHGNPGIVVRQLEFIGKKVSNYDNHKKDINESCSKITELFEELNVDKNSVIKCKEILEIVNSKGVDVSSSFDPLTTQSNNIQSMINGFNEKFKNISLDLKNLINEMEIECNKVGPLNDFKIE